MTYLYLTDFQTIFCMVRHRKSTIFSAPYRPPNTLIHRVNFSLIFWINLHRRKTKMALIDLISNDISLIETGKHTPRNFLSNYNCTKADPNYQIYKKSAFTFVKSKSKWISVEIFKEIINDLNKVYQLEEKMLRWVIVTWDFFRWGSLIRDLLCLKNVQFTLITPNRTILTTLLTKTFKQTILKIQFTWIQLRSAMFICFISPRGWPASSR